MVFNSKQALSLSPCRFRTLQLIAFLMNMGLQGRSISRSRFVIPLATVWQTRRFCNSFWSRLDTHKTIFLKFCDTIVYYNDRQIRSILARFLFYGDDVYKNVGILSPGEKSRVALAKLSISGANLLLLDEPTNHLDPDTQNLIAEVFKNYTGTMVVVSHNPEFVDNLGIERTLILPTGEISYYNREIVEHYKVLNRGKGR